ncbi:MAG: AlpA family phage regulatory protein [Geobacter sp.]|nr:AlpA family phage regulatory protein [Geobacter sp.]
MQEQLVRLDQIIGSVKKGLAPMIPVSRSTIWQWVKDGKFPQPLKLGPATTCWRMSDISAHVKALGGNHE